jgi:tRNA pseudouridine55 synthase
LARDLGEAAGCGAYLSKLRRTRSGDFSLAQCHQLPDLEARIAALAPPLAPPEL